MTPTKARPRTSGGYGSTAQQLNDMNDLRQAAEGDLIIPAHAIPWAAYGSIQSPPFAVFSTTLVCQYQLQAGWRGLLTGLMNVFTDPNNTFIEGSGDIVWTVDVDTPAGVAAALATGRTLPGYGSIVRTLGSLSHPWPMCPGETIRNRGWIMFPLETYRYKVMTVANVTVGSPAFVHCYMGGLIWPAC